MESVAADRHFSSLVGVIGSSIPLQAIPRGIRNELTSLTELLHDLRNVCGKPSSATHQDSHGGLGQHPVRADLGL